MIPDSCNGWESGKLLGAAEIVVIWRDGEGLEGDVKIASTGNSDLLQESQLTTPVFAPMAHLTLPAP